jgi:hypothetical protein
MFRRLFPARLDNEAIAATRLRCGGSVSLSG